MTITLREITPDNVRAVRALRTTVDQQRFVSSVGDSLEEADQVPQANPWCRAVYADSEPVGFVMLAWNVDPQPPGIIGPWYGGPVGFYEALGFVSQGVVDEDGELFARLPLDG